MKKLLQLPIFIVAVTMGLSAQAQRYLTEVFTSGQIETIADETYATNINWLISDFSDQGVVTSEMTEIHTANMTGNPIPAQYFDPSSETAVKVTNLTMDIRKPMDSEDNVDARPAIIFVHTGNFLPPLVNEGITGSKRDSSAVNLAKQWAKRGFVAVNASYRVGWNPVSPDADVRRGTLLNAVYRAIHDIKMAVRYLKTNAEELGIDQIILYGQGSGGYIVQAYITLDDIAELFLPKFIDSNTGTSYVNTTLVGNIDGYSGALNLYLDEGVPADVAFAVNAGGAMGDESWLEGGEVPQVAFHVVQDPFAPFDQGTVIVPTTNEDVVDVHGSNFVIQKAVDLGNNDAFVDFPSDPYTDRARSLYGETVPYIYPSPNDGITINETPEGLFPFVRPVSDISVFANESGPWDWWDFATLQQVVAGYNAATGASLDAAELHGEGLAGNPGMGPDKGLAHIDTIQGYMIPRIVAALDLSTGIDEVEEANVNLELYPNPATDLITIKADGETIDHLEVYDLNGRRVRISAVNNTTVTLQRGDLESGMYVLNLWFDGKRSTTKVVFR